MGQCEPCLSPGAQRVGEVARTFGQGGGRAGPVAPRGRPDTRVPSETRLPTAAPRRSLEARGPLCPAVIWGAGVSHPNLLRVRPPTPFAAGPSALKSQHQRARLRGSPQGPQGPPAWPSQGTRAQRRAQAEPRGQAPARGSLSANRPGTEGGLGRRPASPTLSACGAAERPRRGARRTAGLRLGDLGRGPAAPRHLDAERGRV